MPTHAETFEPAPEKRVGSERSKLTHDGMRAKAEEGGHNGPAPLGYLSRREGCRAWVEPDPAAAPLVREAHRLFYDEGLSVRQVARRMTAKGLRSRHGNEIGPSAMHGILTNPFYRGFVRSGGMLFPGSHVPLVGGSAIGKNV